MINIGIYGYGNLGKGVELAVTSSQDMNLIGVFTRRNPDSVKTLTGAKVYSSSELLSFKDKIDVLILCGGSATDLPTMTPELAKNFNVVDSFDTHAKIPTHFDNVDKSAKENSHVALISAGWDPGMFSISRLYAQSILPNGKLRTTPIVAPSTANPKYFTRYKVLIPKLLIPIAFITPISRNSSESVKVMVNFKTKNAIRIRIILTTSKMPTTIISKI